jgi:hypothetical protein
MPVEIAGGEGGRPWKNQSALGPKGLSVTSQGPKVFFIGGHGLTLAVGIIEILRGAGFP